MATYAPLVRVVAYGLYLSLSMAENATTVAVMEAAEKKVAVKASWLENSMPNERATRGGIWPSSHSH